MFTKRVIYYANRMRIMHTGIKFSARIYDLDKSIKSVRIFQWFSTEIILEFMKFNAITPITCDIFKHKLYYLPFLSECTDEVVNDFFESTDGKLLWASLTTINKNIAPNPTRVIPKIHM